MSCHTSILGVDYVFSWALAMTTFRMYQFCNVTDHLLMEMFDTQPCDSVYGKYCKVNNQHYPELGLQHQAVPQENSKLLPGASSAAVNQQKGVTKWITATGASCSCSPIHALPGQSICG